MSSKDMFRKEQRFSFRKFSFGLASAVIANVIFGGAIANSPVVHANTATETAAVATSERIASIPYTVNIVDQTGKVVETKEKKVLVYTVETIATATEYLTADLVPEGYAIVSGLGEVTLTEKADNIFTVKVDKIAPEAAPTTTAESATSETSTAAATPEPASLAATQSTPVTSEVAEAEVAPTTSEESAKPTERTVYLSYITHYVNEANETVDRTGHLVAVTTTDDTAKTQVTVSASENMPSGWELIQDKAKVVVQLVENQTNILVFAVTKKSKEEEIAESQLANKDVLEQVLSEGVLLSNDAARLLETSQAGNTGLEVATNNTKAVLKEAIQVFDEPTSTQEQVDAQTELVRAASKTLADELLKFDEDGVLTAMLDATTQGITITTSSKGAVRPDYQNHIRDFATNTGQQSYNNQDFFFGLIGKELTQENSQIRATAQAPDGSTPTISIVDGGWQPLTESKKYGLEINNSGVIYGTTTIPDAGNAFSWWFRASSSGYDSVGKQFTFVPYTVVKTDDEPIRRAVQAGVTADDILAKVKSDVTRGDGSRQGPLNATFEEYFNSELTARATGKSTTVADTDKTGKQIWHEIVGEIPTTAGTHTVTVRSTNVHGQTIDTAVVVDLYDFEAKDRAEVRKYTDWDKPIHAIIEIGKTGEEAAVVLENIPDDFQIENFNITDEAATKLAERNLEFVKNAQVEDKADTVDNKKDGIVGYIRPKAAYGNVATYTGSSNIAYKFKYKNLNDATADETNDELSYTILFIDTQKPVVTPKSEYIRFVNEAYTISVPGTDNAYLDTGKINGSLSVLKDGETGKVSPGLGTGTNIASELDPTGKGNQGENSTKFNVNITGTGPAEQGTGDYNLRVGENNYPAGPDVERVDGKKPENVGLTPITVTFVKRAAVTTPVAVVDPANLTTEEKAAVIAQLKKDNADNQRLQDLPDSAFTVNADGTVSVDYSAGGTNIDAVTDTVQNATVKLADAQKEAKDAIDAKLAEEKAAIEAKRDADIAEINNTPGLTDDQKKAARDAVTDTAGDALKALDKAADDAKKAIDAETTVAGINNAKTDGEKALDDATVNGEAAIDLTKDKELAKADVDNQAKAAIEAVKNNPNLDATEQAPYIEAIEKAAEEQKAAIDKAKDTAGITDAVNAAEKVNEEQKLAAAKQDAKNKIAEEAAAAKDAIDKNPNLSEDEKRTFKDAVDKAAQTANDAIDKATTPAEVQTAEDNGVKAIDAKELDAAKQDAKNKIAKDVEAAKDAIDKNPNLSEDEKQGFKDAVDVAAQTANGEIDKATTPETVQTAEDNGVKAIDAKELAAAKQDAKNKIAKDVEAANAAIESNPNLSEKEIADAKAEVAKAAEDANKAIAAATTPETAQTAEEAGTKEIAADVLDAAKQDAKNKIAKDLATVEAAIDANSNLSEDEKKAAKLAAQAKAADAVTNIEKATTPAAVQTLEDAAVKELANIEIKAAYDDAVKAIEAADNLSTAAKTKALDDLKKARQAAEDAVKKATTADEVAKGALDGLKSIAKIEATAAADDAKAAIAQNSNLTDDEKKVYTDAIDKALKDTETKIDAATDADTVDAETIVGQKAFAKEEVKAATADAVKGIEANTNLTDDEKAIYKEEVAKAVAAAETAIKEATKAADIQSKTFDATQAAAKEEVKADAADAVKGIQANDNLSDTAKEEAIAAIEKARNTTLENIENAKTAAAVDTATLDAEKANAKAEIKAAADDAKKAIDENANLPASDKNALKLAIDAEVAATNLEIDNAKTAEEIDAATLVTEKSIAKAEVKAAAEDALQAIDENANLTDDEKAAAKADVYVELSKAEKAIDKATTADAIDNATLVGEKAFATAELEAAADDAKKAIDANTHLTDDQKQAAKDAVDAELAKAKEAVVAAKTADEVDAATLVGEKAIAKEEIKAAAEDAKAAIDANDNLTDAEKQAAKDAVDAEVAKANEAIDKAATADAVDAATLVGEKAVAKEELKAAAEDAKKAIDANDNLTDAEKQAAKDAVDAEVAKANDAIDAATKADEVETATLAGEKAVAKEEVKAAAEDAKKAIDANDNLTPEEKAAAKEAVDAEVAKANDAIDAATKADEVETATLVGEKAVAKEELKAAAEDAKAAIDANDNLTPEEKAAAKAAVDAEVAKANDAIDAATKADEVETATLAGEKAVAKEELKAAAEDAKKAIDANDNLTPEEKAAATKAVDAEVAKANEAIDAATKADEVETATLAGEKAVAKEEVKAAAEDAKKAIDANDNLTDAEKQAAKDAVDAELAKANDAIDAATKADEVDVATLAGEKAVAKEALKAAAEDAKKAIDAAKQGAKNKLMEEADKAKAAIDANPNLTPEEKAAAKAEIDKAVEEAIISINGAGTHHALGEIKLPLSALIKPVVTVTPVLDPNNLTEEEIARIKALLEENNTFPEGTEIIVSKDASVSIKYPDGSIDLILPAEIVKQADTTAPAITDDAKGNIVVAPTKEAVEFVVTYVDNNGKAQLVVVTKGADGKWTTTAKAVIVDPVTGQVIIPGSAIKPGTVVTAYSKDMAGNVSDLNSAEVEAVDANNPAAGVKVKSVTSTSNANKSTKKAKQLPNTGEKATSATSLGLAVLGMGLALFAAKRKKDEEEA
ncbi:TPA: DUF1542 domain-containing protein [Streptococcus suis]|nr:DUF1542 domain-containing protein [Streptococcus suis]